jgi:hypothetical protein
VVFSIHTTVLDPAALSAEERAAFERHASGETAGSDARA